MVHQRPAQAVVPLGRQPGRRLQQALQRRHVAGGGGAARGFQRHWEGHPAVLRASRALLVRFRSSLGLPGLTWQLVAAKKDYFHMHAVNSCKRGPERGFNNLPGPKCGEGEERCGRLCYAARQSRRSPLKQEAELTRSSPCTVQCI